MEAEYCIANGHTHDAEIIYGDTDSVMVRFGPNDLAKVMALGMFFLSTTEVAIPGQQLTVYFRK